MGQTAHWHFSVWCVEGPAAAAGIPRALLSRAGSLPPCSTVRLVVLAATLQLKTCKDTEFPGGSGLKTLPPMPETTGEGGSIPGWGRPPGGGHQNPLQCSCLENPRDRGASQETVCGVARESDTTEPLSAHGDGQGTDSGGGMSCVLKEACYVWGNRLGMLFFKFYLLV